MRRLINLIKSLLSSDKQSLSSKRFITFFVVLLFSILLCIGAKPDPKLIDALVILAGGGIVGNVVEKFAEKDL